MNFPKKFISITISVLKSTNFFLTFLPEQTLHWIGLSTIFFFFKLWWGSLGENLLTQLKRMQQKVYILSEQRLAPKVAKFYTHLFVWWGALQHSNVCKINFCDSAELPFHSFSTFQSQIAYFTIFLGSLFSGVDKCLLTGPFQKLKQPWKGLCCRSKLNLGLN